ncbi:UDP-N-acetylmuramoyl-tripeptide--D-alanyl-D-alanine ligase [Engelhardtia mirabilis]|uniref:UDP-N-acetylmuramoyl-tripeptide--D-alanyl-D-alanine ligase n=1 Tax=Engelhardtia mirabilis TaxID=2528011 RepID=A0A518BIB5_9BACT|nr:UDP-N-acetylmuramoyl-tripeptide--D-alanyl-D-alanine ligase MurF [Planctomycetes bacterium Pla133]QDV01031.1 UDP-N-acetylmuramoyl-tripeptide--D-alanyl-D-alanine ligase MurF [Planctomycetes bacterium Pla86]
MIRLTFKELLAATGAREVRPHHGEPMVGVSTDSRSVRPGELFVALSGPNFDGTRFAPGAAAAGAAALLVREGGMLDLEALPPGIGVAVHDDPLRALGDLAAWHRSRLKAPVIAITGSCGKTSTKNILAQLLQQAGETVASPGSFNNAIGVPLTLFLADEDTDFVVVEVGTSGPGEIAALCRIARPDVGLVTNVGASHLLGLGSVDGVAEEKSALPASLSDTGLLIVNDDCRYSKLMRSRNRGRTIGFSVDGDGASDLDATDVLFHSGGTSFRLDGVEVASPLLGTHNVQNLLAALAVCDGLSVPRAKVLPAVQRLAGARRRMERHELGELTVFDDSYNSNPSSALAAVRVLEGLFGYRRRVLVLGDMLELGELAAELHHQVGMEAARAGLEVVVAVGELAKAAAAGALEGGMPPEAVHHLERAEDAARVVPDLVRHGDAVLVKASRALALERVVDALIARHRREAC